MPQWCTIFTPLTDFELVIQALDSTGSTASVAWQDDGDDRLLLDATTVFDP